MQIEAGKYYNDRVGDIWGPTRLLWPSGPWTAARVDAADVLGTWTSYGEYRIDGTTHPKHLRDLIAVVSSTDMAPTGAMRVQERTNASGGAGGTDRATFAGVAGVAGTTQDAANAQMFGKLGASPRGAILLEGAVLTAGRRNDSYGDPKFNVVAAGRLKDLFREVTRRNISPGEQEAIDQVLTKLARIATGKTLRDNYVDAATYIAIAGELALAAATSSEHSDNASQAGSGPSQLFKEKLD